jgi:hypothetical protein
MSERVRERVHRGGMRIQAINMASEFFGGSLNSDYQYTNLLTLERQPALKFAPTLTVAN